ncbi:MAG: hypothetical protein WAV95_15780 [Azonexus sp.]
MAINRFLPWENVNRVGLAWHGHQIGGDIFNRLGGAQISLPTGVAYQRAVDGAAYLVDLGMPDVVTSEAEIAGGICWWNKAILGGSNRLYNAVRGAATPPIEVRKSAWFYRCSDGTVYVLDAYQKTVRASKVTVPTSPMPIQQGVGTSVFSFSGISGDVAFVNFSPDGKKAAIHMVNPSAIIELAISGGDIDVAPSVAATRTRLVADLELVGEVTSWPEYVDGGVIGNPRNPYQNNGWMIWPWSAQKPGDFWFAGFNGTLEQQWSYIKAVGYDASGTPVDIGFSDVNRWTFSSTFAQDSESFWYMRVSGSNSRSRFVFSGAQRANYYTENFTFADWTTYQWGSKTGDPGTQSEVIVTGDSSVVPSFIYGNVVVGANLPATFSPSTGILEPTPVNISAFASPFGCGGGGSVIAANVPFSNFSIDPESGVFTPARTRYF